MLTVGCELRRSVKGAVVARVLIYVDDCLEIAGPAPIRVSDDSNTVFISTYAAAYVSRSINPCCTR